MRVSLRISFISACIFLLSCISFKASAHVNIVENDTTICPGTSLTFHGVGATPISLVVDDMYSGIVPIGFTFNFYGNNYTTCVISSNGFISFNLSNANQYSAWAIGNGIPGNTNCLNAVMGNYTDILPQAGGIIDYVTVGNAPNRMFVVTFCSVPMFLCTTITTTFQMVLHETTNIADVHIRDKPICATWNAGAAIEGVQNATGTLATVVPGRNFPGTWTATNSSHSFTPGVPAATANYSVNAIPFAPIATSGTNFAWFANTMVGVPFATTQNITVAPTVNTTYYLREIHCADTTFDSVKVTIGGGGNISSATKTDPTTCGGTDGKITLNGLPVSTIYTVHYSKNTVAQPTYSTTTSPTGTVVINNLGAGNYSNIYLVSTTNCPTNTVGPLILINPALTANFNSITHYGCASDTVLFFNLSQTPGPLQYQWQFGDNTGDTAKNPIHVYYNQAVYSVRLIATNGSCADTAVQSVDLVHPLEASFTVDKDSACSQQLVTFTNTSITTTKNNINPQYFWDFGDGSTSTAQSPSHAYLYSGVYYVRMVVQDFVPCFDTAYHTIVIDSIPFIDFTVSDSVLCSGQGITFTGDYLRIGNTGIEWSFSDGHRIINQNPVSHAFDSAGLAYVKFTAHYRLCPDTSVTKTINIKPFPTINLGPDTALCPGGAPIALTDHPIDPTGDYLWSNGDKTGYTSVNADGNYWATITKDGCSASDSVLVAKDCYIDMPNSFTPNGDGLNEYFFPRQLLGRSIAYFKMSIFDRWGQIIFETTNINGRGWDGRFNDVPQPQGVYVYMVDVGFINGKKEHYVGNVTLLR